MKQTLDHLPARKQARLRAAADAIRALTEVEVIILFGSYARGDYVEDPEGGYVSDADMLVLVHDERVAGDDELWTKAEARAERAMRGIPVDLVVHTVEDVNSKLERGWYFFVDAYKEGIMLYNSYRTQLAEPGQMTLAQRHDFAQACFGEYFDKANWLYRFFEFYLQNERNNEAAFMLHQATETHYKTMLMVFKAYRPKQHNIEKLASKCSKLHGDMGGIFPMNTPEDRARFKLLEHAYVEARYSLKYSITREDLDILASHVRELRSRTERLCGERIAALAAAAAEPAPATPPNERE